MSSIVLDELVDNTSDAVREEHRLFIQNLATICEVANVAEAKYCPHLSIGRY